MKTPFLISSQGSNISESAVQAFAKLTGENWTFYVQDLSVSIGRSSDSQDNSEDQVDLDLGKSKTISRKHAKISFNFNTRAWELFVNGRNGLKVNNVHFKSSKDPIPLESNTMLEIGGNQFMFTLPLTPAVETSRPQEKPKKVVEKPVKKMYPKENPPPNLVKPTASYAALIAEAISSSPDNRMTLACIYNYIADNYEYYQYANNGWQNSVRHNLSLNKAFKKVPREANEAGKGMHWTIDSEFIGALDDPKKRPRAPKEDDMMKRIRLGQIGYDHAASGYGMWNPQPYWGYTNPYSAPYFYDPNSHAPLGQPHGPPMMPPGPMTMPLGMPGGLLPLHKQPPFIKPDNLDGEEMLILPNAGYLMRILPLQFYQMKLIDAEPPIIPQNTSEKHEKESTALSITKNQPKITDKNASLSSSNSASAHPNSASIKSHNANQSALGLTAEKAMAKNVYTAVNKPSSSATQILLT